jgi:glyoxylase I family protein
MRAGGFHHLALRVSDVARALAFYSGVLGLTEIRRKEVDGALSAVWLEASPGVLMLERTLRGEGPSQGSGHLLAFEVSDLEAWKVRLEGAGIPVLDRTEDSLYVQDPDGHRVGLSRFPR